MKGVFLFGTGRSGTTVLRHCFSQNPDVASMPGELRLITDPNGVLDTYRALSLDWDPYKANHAIHHFLGLLRHVSSMSTAQYRQHDTDRWTGGNDWYLDRVDQLLQDLIEGKDSTRWTGAHPESDHMFETRWTVGKHVAHVLEDFVVDLFKQRNETASFFVEDTPYTGCHWGTVKQVFDNPQPVFCVRHPRDIYSSFLHGGKHWTPSDPRLAAVRISETIYKTVSELGSQAQRALWRLEDFADNPVGALGELCSRIGLGTDYCVDMQKPFNYAKANIGRADGELSEVEALVYMEHLSWAEETLGYV